MKKARRPMKGFGLDGVAGINHENNICADFAQIQSEPVNVWAVNQASLQQYSDQSNSMDDWTLRSV